MLFSSLLPLRLLRFDFAHHDGEVRKWLENRADAAAGARRMPLEHDGLTDMSLGDDQIVDVEVVIVLRIGDCRFQAFAHVAGNALAREFEIGKRGRDLLAANELRKQVELLRADAQHPRDGLGLVIGQIPLALLLAHRYSPNLTTRRPTAPPPAPQHRRRRCAWPFDPTNGRRTNASART